MAKKSKKREPGKQRTPVKKKSTQSATTRESPGSGKLPTSKGQAANPSPADCEHRFPIVGIGASAGGLEALQQFFDAMPSDQTVAFIVVTHQHAGHTSMLPELLAKRTEMPVREVRDGERVEPGHVYVAPSSGQLHVLGGKLHLIAADPGFHLPIDSFFRSLAIDQRGQAIGIVMSGTGTDGTLGVKALKGEAGMVMVQDPAGAKFDGMPRSAIATGLVDFVLPPEKMPAELLGYAKGPYLACAQAAPPTHPELADVLPKIFVLLRSRTRRDFSHYKANTVRRRIERRMSVHQIRKAQDYLRFLQETPHELDVLFRDLLIGVTSFFRDPEAYAALADDILPAQIRELPDNHVYRIWSAGCSTGEEAYSLAMVAQEVIESTNPGVRLQVFGTDLDDRAIDVARRGLYPGGIAADITEPRLRRFFCKEEGHYRIQNQLRESLVFAPQDIISDPPFTRLDLLSCRNLLIYLDGELQRKLLPVFHYAVRPGGLLFLGNSESIGNAANLFQTLDKRAKIFQRTDASHSVRLLPPRDTMVPRLPSLPDENHVSEKSIPESRDEDLQRLLERRMLHHHVPPTVVVSDRGEIVYIHGRTGAFLELAPGEASNNILKMARQGLQPALSTLIRRAAAEGADAAQHNLHVTANGGSLIVDLVVRPIKEPEQIRGLLMVSFEDSRPAVGESTEKQARPKSRGRAAQLEQQLAYTKESLQNTIEELETANEEHKSSNEELQSTNEELQSTNEELETSKEEMQSLNEELQTVNAELQMKIEDLALVNDDMTNLLNNTNIATVFLDQDLNIKRFTSALSHVVKIIPTDVGRPIGDLVSNLEYDLVRDASEVLATLSSRETEVRSTDDRWYHVRLMPYRTSDHVISGLVATFVDVTKNKTAELQVTAAADYAQSIVDTVREPLLVLDDQLHVVSANQAFLTTFQVSTAETVGQSVYELGNGQWDVLALRELLEQVLPRDTRFEDVRIEHEFPRIGRRTMVLNGRRLEQAITLPGRILLAMEDVTD